MASFLLGKANKLPQTERIEDFVTRQFIWTHLKQPDPDCLYAVWEDFIEGNCGKTESFPSENIIKLCTIIILYRIYSKY